MGWIKPFAVQRMSRPWNPSIIYLGSLARRRIRPVIECSARSMDVILFMKSAMSGLVLVAASVLELSDSGVLGSLTFLDPVLVQSICASTPGANGPSPIVITFSSRNQDGSLKSTFGASLFPFARCLRLRAEPYFANRVSRSGSSDGGFPLSGCAR